MFNLRLLRACATAIPLACLDFAGCSSSAKSSPVIIEDRGNAAIVTLASSTSASIGKQPVDEAVMSTLASDSTEAEGSPTTFSKGQGAHGIKGGDSAVQASDTGQGAASAADSLRAQGDKVLNASSSSKANSSSSPSQSAEQVSTKESKLPPEGAANSESYELAQLRILEELRASQEKRLASLSSEERASAEASLEALNSDIKGRRARLSNQDPALSRSSDLGEFNEEPRDSGNARNAHLGSPSQVTSDASSQKSQSKSDANSYRLSRESDLPSDRMNELLPRVPYYIAGTKETGVVEIKAEVTPSGQKQYALRFLDPASRSSSLRDSVLMPDADLRGFQAGLSKLDTWSKEAHDQGIRRVFSKQASCSPVAACTASSGSRVEVLFLIYEDGSTSGRIVLHKGSYEQGYNLSIDSAKLLRTNLDYTLKTFSKEVSAKSKSKKSLDRMFK